MLKTQEHCASERFLSRSKISKASNTFREKGARLSENTIFGRNRANSTDKTHSFSVPVVIFSIRWCHLIVSIALLSLKCCSARFHLTCPRVWRSNCSKVFLPESSLLTLLKAESSSCKDFTRAISPNQWSAPPHLYFSFFFGVLLFFRFHCVTLPPCLHSLNPLFRRRDGVGLVFRRSG